MRLTDAEMKDLSGVARVAYDRELTKRLTDPDRLAKVYAGWWNATAHKIRLGALVGAASYAMGTSHAGISLVDHLEQRMVVMFGDLPDIKPISQSYCKHTLDGTSFSVNDATVHPLVCDTEAAVDGSIRSYLGVPLTIDDEVVGSLCVWDTNDRRWTATDVDVLSQFAGQVMEVFGL
jgi:GAF domain-containing protein